MRPLTISGAALVIGVTISAGFVFAAELPELRVLWAIRASGYLGLFMLSASLVLSPLRRFGVDSAIELRRAFGLCAALVATIHFGIALTSPFVAEWALVLYEPLLRAGATTWLVLVMLAATSFPRRWAAARWKALHRLVYVAAPLALHHLLLSPHTPRWAFIAFVSVLTLAIGLRIVGWARARQSS